MRYTSHIELNKKALRKNINFLQKKIGKKTKFASVIKGNAYGHGLRKFLPMAEECGLNYFAVSDSFEAEMALQVKKPETDLMIMNMIDNEDLEWAIENDISYYIFDYDRLEHTIDASKNVGKKARIHLELETGMNRTGFEFNELIKLSDIIKTNNDHLFIEGVCTHYAGAESIANYVRVTDQIKKFNEMSYVLGELGIKPKYYHTACSAAVLTYPATAMDMVRIGIAQYGFWPSKETKMHNLLTSEIKYKTDPLQRVISWKSRVMTIKEVSPGRFVGYGNHYLTTKTQKIAVIPVGYSHGYSRSLSNLGHVIINRKKHPVVGLVNMNMILVDVTHDPNVSKSDEVVLIGAQGKQAITVASFAELSNYVNYEMLTRLPNEIPRIIRN